MHYAQAQSQLPLQGNGSVAPATGADSRSFVRTTESHPLPFNTSSGIQRQGSQLALPSPPASEPSIGTGEIVKPRSTSHIGTSSTSWAYSDGVKKYDYTEGYHFLMSYLHDRCVLSSDLLGFIADCHDWARGRCGCCLYTEQKLIRGCGVLDSILRHFPTLRGMILWLAQ
jgi:hypothetical protein